MEYLLTLQFPFSGDKDFDKFINLEEDLEELFADSADVDGNDAGSEEMNIFVLSDNPEETFKTANSYIENAGLLESLSAVYRKVDSEDYTRLWPVNSSEPFIVR